MPQSLQWPGRSGDYADNGSVYIVGNRGCASFFEPRRHNDTEVHSINYNCEPLCRCVSVVQKKVRSLYIFQQFISWVSGFIFCIPAAGKIEYGYINYKYEIKQGQSPPVLFGYGRIWSGSIP